MSFYHTLSSLHNCITHTTQHNNNPHTPQKTLQIQLFCFVFLVVFVEFFATKFCMLLSKIIFGKMIFDEKNFFRFSSFSSIFHSAIHIIYSPLPLQKHIYRHHSTPFTLWTKCQNYSITLRSAQSFFYLPYTKFTLTRAHVQAQACAFHIIYARDAHKLYALGRTSVGNQATFERLPIANIKCACIQN